jgi:hypothetical protein
VITEEAISSFFVDGVIGWDYDFAALRLVVTLENGSQETAISWFIIKPSSVDATTKNLANNFFMMQWVFQVGTVKESNFSLHCFSVDMTKQKNFNLLYPAPMKNQNQIEREENSWRFSRHFF